MVCRRRVDENLVVSDEVWIRGRKVAEEDVGGPLRVPYGVVDKGGEIGGGGDLLVVVAVVVGVVGVVGVIWESHVGGVVEAGIGEVGWEVRVDWGHEVGVGGVEDGA